MYETDSVKFIEVNLVDLLTGDPAITAARNFGDAELEIDEDSDTSWFVPNDYYICNNLKMILFNIS